MYKKRGQVTILIIVGTIIFLSFILISYIQKTYLEGEVKPEIYIGQDFNAKFNSLNSYIGYCIREVAEPQQKALSRIRQIASQGGKLFNFTDKIEYLARDINVLCTETENKGCVQNILLKEDMEQQLSSYFRLQLLACIDLDDFRDKGYTINADEDELKLETTIANDDVFVKISYPIILISQEKKLKTEKFSHRIKTPLGRLYDLAIDIVNKKDFNKDEWMVKNKAQVIIEKHKPYPNTIYSLTKDNLKFQFAVRGIETVGRTYPDLTPNYGCCNVKEYCFKNVLEDDCPGQYNSDPSCRCEDMSWYENSTKFMANCWLRKHGSSWCSYDSIAGESLDYVGSRHYLHTCINGQEIIEECRDFREELCTEQPINNSTKAVCRKNRWQDCHACSTKTCCQDTKLRDCVWNGFLETDIKCSPAVPPGLKFWENKGKEICSVANEKKEFTGFKVRNAWIDSTAMLCTFMGDCGNYRNIRDKITKNGFRNTDGPENEYTYLDKGNPPKADNFVVSLPLDTVDQEILDLEFKSPSNYPTVEEITAALKNLDSYKPDLFDTFKRKKVKRPALSRCELWTQPTNTKDCSQCELPNKACSEYRCKSLGEQCQFTYLKGIPKCFAPGEGDTIPPEITVDNMILKDYNYTAASLGTNTSVWFRGYEISPPIRPHTPITIGVKTSEPTKCKITYLPENDFNSLPQLWFGDNIYSESHNLTFRFPSTITIPEGVFEAFNISSLNNILDLPGLSNKMQKLAMIKLLDEFKHNNYYLFVKCNDEYGNENKDEFFIRFRLESDKEDNEEPIIVAAIPENNSLLSLSSNELSLSIYINEPAECSASSEDTSYNDMEYRFNCATSEYDISDIGAGTYKCSSLLPVAKRYFIRCADNPIPVSTFYITLIQEDNFSIIKDISGKINLTGDTIIVPAGTLLTDPATKIATYFEPRLEFSLSPLAECRFSNTSKTFDEMENIINCAGINKTSQCSTLLPLIDNISRYYIKCRELNITNMVNRNINSESYIYHISYSPGLNITSVSPEAQVNTDSPKLAVTTSGDVFEDKIRCAYDGHLMDLQDGKFVKQMHGLNNFEEYSYKIECRNKYGDVANEELRFTVVIS